MKLPSCEPHHSHVNDCHSQDTAHVLASLQTIFLLDYILNIKNYCKFNHLKQYNY